MLVKCSSDVMLDSVRGVFFFTFGLDELSISHDL